jgi:amidohydrolase
MDIQREAEGVMPELIRLRRYFHQHPEQSWHEAGTQKKIEEFLTGEGIPFHEVCRTGVIADIAGKSSGSRILGIRADIDALPVQEETGLPFASENPGTMHACGHDVHIAVLLETAKLLNRHRDELKVRVRLLFQPAEEFIEDSGAAHMRELPEVREISRLIGLHIGSAIPCGQAYLGEGPIMASADTFDIRIQGKGGHGAHPEECIDPISAGIRFCEGVNRFLARVKNPLLPAVISITSFQAGNTSNVIPDSAHLSGTTRAGDPGLRDQFEGILRKIGEAVTLETGAAVEVDYHYGCPVTVNDPAAAITGRRAAEEVFGRENVIKIPFLMIGEDFSKYTNEKAFLWLGGGLQDKNKVFPQHSPHYLADETALPLGVRYFLTYVREYQNEAEKKD